MTPSRVAYVLNVFPKVSETFIVGELAQLRRSGVEVLILSLRAPAEEARRGVVPEAGLVERAVYDPKAFRAALRAFRPQIIHAHFATEPAAAAMELASQLRVPFTFTAHGYDVYRRPPADFGARAAAAAAVVTVSEANARTIAETFGVRAGHVHVIPCGIDTAAFRPNGARAGPPHVVCVARLSPVKNIELLLEACAALTRRGLDLRCAIVGDGRERESLEALWRRLGLEGVVTFLGSRSQREVLSWWQRASVAVLTSTSEGAPVSLMEAASCGVPAVATAVGGVPELVEDGVTGVLVRSGDANALASALERLLLDPGLAARLGRAAQRRAQDRFDVRRQVAHLHRLWGDVLREALA